MVTQINTDGTLTVILTQQEQTWAQMLLAESGADTFTKVFQMHFDNQIRGIMRERFERLAPVDRNELLGKLAAVPERGRP